MKRFLVPTDLSEAARAAFPVAKELATLSCESEISLITVLEELLPAAAQCEFGLSFFDPTKLSEEASEEAEREMKNICEKFFPGQMVRSYVLRGLHSVASEIAKFATEQSIDLIILATHGRGGLRHLLLGSVAEHLIREAPCPVLVVPDRRGEERRSLL